MSAVVKHNPPPAPPATFDIVGLTQEELNIIARAVYIGRYSEIAKNGRYSVVGSLVTMLQKAGADTSHPNRDSDDWAKALQRKYELEPKTQPAQPKFWPHTDAMPPLAPPARFKLGDVQFQTDINGGAGWLPQPYIAP